MMGLLWGWAHIEGVDFQAALSDGDGKKSEAILNKMVSLTLFYGGRWILITVVPL